MNRTLSTLLLFVATITTAFSQESLHKDLIELDSEVRIGKLDNGLTYYLRHNENPKNRADFYIANKVGALQEEDNQNGLAHFLEHLAFNGLKHFPGKAMDNYLAANGVRFGYNVNAYTSRNRTVYNISNVPLTRESFIDSVVLILHDWSSFILCEPKEIESERGVIREEWRLGDDPRSRMATKQDGLLYKGSKYTERDVIGDFNIINTFERQTLVDFYHKWYRPDMQAVIIVGDFDVDKMEERVKKILSDLPKVENGAQKEEYIIPALTSPLVSVATDPDINYYTVKYFLKQRHPSSEQLQYFSSSFQHLFKREIFTNMVSSRFSKRSKEEGCNFKNAVMVSSALAQQKYVSMMTISPKSEEQMLAALKDVLIELKKIEKYGFYKEEFKTAKTQSQKRLRLNKVRKAEEVTNEELVSSYVNHFTLGLPFQYPTQLQQNQIRVFKQITLKDINDLIPEMITEAEQIVMHSVNEKKISIAPSEESTLALLEEIKNLEVTPISRENVKELSLNLEGLQGSPIKKIKELNHLGAQEWSLENGIKVIWTPAPEPNGNYQVYLFAKSNLGLLSSNDIKVDKIAAQAVGRMGIKNITSEELEDVLSEYDFRTTFRIGKTQTDITCNTSEKELEPMLAKLYLNITEPYFDPAYLERQKMFYFDNLRTKVSKNNYTEFLDSMDRVLHNYNPLTLRVDSAAYARITLDDVKALFDQQFSNMKNFTFYVTSSLPAEKVKPLIEKYIGSLPVVSGKIKTPKNTLKIADGDMTYNHEGRERDIPKANVLCNYHGKIKYNVLNNMTFKYLKQLMWMRYIISIREGKGGTYSISSSGVLSPDNKGTFEFVVDFQTDPKLVDDLVAEVDKGIRSLAEEGPSVKEMEDTQKYLVKSIVDSRNRRYKNLMFWGDKAVLLYETGIDLDEENIELINSITPEDIQKMAQTIVSGDLFTAIYKEKYTNN